MGGATGELIRLEGGVFTMGSADPLSYPDDGEESREVELDPFAMAAEAVSNANFAKFVEATGHTTDAEGYGWSFVFAGLLPDDFPDTRGVAKAPWWRQVYGADWRHPEGPDSDLTEKASHPVVHVSWQDATAYCEWLGMRLPSEAEWEFAARGGLAGKVFPWGDALEPGGAHLMNVWQGDFPANNTAGDGYYGTAPSDAFEPNGFGLYNATGNVWEWTADWFATSFRAGDERRNPRGPSSGEFRVQKGGSYLCHESYCRRYRIAARQGNEPDSSAGNVGFRSAAEA